MDIQDVILKIVQDTPTRMTETQLIESQEGDSWVRVLLVDTDGNPVPVQYDHEGRLKMAGHECLAFRKAARQAAQALSQWVKTSHLIRNGALASSINGRGLSDSLTREALAALADVGVQP